MLFCWGLWPIHICVVIDHFSRKVMAAVPLEGPNAGWINNALESAIEKYGPPKHIISDHSGAFIGEVFAKLLGKYNIKGIDHLTELCKEFELWYNSWRPHMTLDGFRPDDVYFDNKPEKPKRDVKTVPCNIEQHFFSQTRITGYRLTKAA